MTETRMHLLNGGALAFIGDAVYEAHVRRHIVQTTAVTHPNKLHRAAIRYVSAPAQALIIQTWLKEENILTSEELDIYRRGRNYQSNTKAKNATIGQYRQATGFESVIGWLSLTQQEERMNELIDKAIEVIEKGETNEIRTKTL